MKKLAVIAFGGNALLRSGQKGTCQEQMQNVADTCQSLLPFLKQGYNLVIGHGNGPQVGNVLLQNEAGLQQFGLPAMPMDVCGAETQGQIGYMIEMRNMHLNQSLIPMICPWIASGIGAYWMISFFKSGLPLELVESARIDGANELVIYFRIALPCIKPGILTLALLQFLWSWNSYIYPLVFVNKQDNYTIPIFVKSLASAYRTDYGAQLAGLTLSTIPVLILFLFGSKSFIKGMTAGAVKG